MLWSHWVPRWSVTHTGKTWGDCIFGGMAEIETLVRGWSRSLDSHVARISECAQIWICILCIIYYAVVLAALKLVWSIGSDSRGLKSSVVVCRSVLILYAVTTPRLPKALGGGSYFVVIRRRYGKFCVEHFVPDGLTVGLWVFGLWS